MTDKRGYAPLVQVWRGDTVESVHFGAIAVADSRGRVLAACGDPGTITFLRSAAKPVQVLPLLASGAAERFGLLDEEIAVMAGSHGGEPFHIEAVRSILRKIGLDESALQCGVHAPYHRPTAQARRRGPMDAAAARVVAAMRRHPEMVAGTDRLCTKLMRAGGGGLIAKIGAEGYCGLGWRRDDAGVGAALKIADGDGLRARPSAAIEALRQMGLLDRPVAAALVARFAPDLKNRRGLPVGRVEPVFDLGAPPSRAAKAGA